MISSAATTSALSDSSLKLPPLDNSLGAWCIATSFGMLFQGILYYQAIRYFQLYQKDPLYLKVWVCTSMILETVNCVFDVHAYYYYTVTHGYNPVILADHLVWSLRFTAIPGCLSAIVSELFFARRTWFIGPRFRPLVVFAVLLQFGNLACFLAMIILGANTDSVEKWLEHSWLAAMGSGFIAAGEVMVTGLLIWALCTNRSSIKQTNSLINTIIKYSLTTGLLGCILRVLSIVCVVLWPRTWIFASVEVITTKISAISFMVAVISRKTLSSKHRVGIGMSTTEGLPATSARHTYLSKSGGRVPLEHSMQFRRPGTSFQTASASDVPQSEVNLELKIVSGGVEVDSEHGTSGHEPEFEFAGLTKPDFAEA